MRFIELTEDVVKSLGPQRLLWVDIDDRDDEGSIDEVVPGSWGSKTSTSTGCVRIVGGPG